MSVLGRAPGSTRAGTPVQVGCLQMHGGSSGRAPQTWGSAPVRAPRSFAGGSWQPHGKVTASSADLTQAFERQVICGKWPSLPCGGQVKKDALGKPGMCQA